MAIFDRFKSSKQKRELMMRPTEAYTSRQSTKEPRSFQASLRRENKTPVDSSKVEPSFLDHMSRPTKAYTIRQKTVEYPTFENSLRKQRTVGNIESDDDDNDSIFDYDTRNPSNSVSLNRLMRPTEAYLSKQNFVEERVVDPFIRT